MRGAHFRCNPGEGGPPLHTTFDCGLAMKNSEHGSNIDVGILKEIVDYGRLKPVLLKASWVKHVSQDQSNIRKDKYRFWICKLHEREDHALRNPYVFPSRVAQVFFMNDQANPNWKVILLNEPRSQRVMGE